MHGVSQKNITAFCVKTEKKVKSHKDVKSIKNRIKSLKETKIAKFS